MIGKWDRPDVPKLLDKWLAQAPAAKLRGRGAPRRR